MSKKFFAEIKRLDKKSTSTPEKDEYDDYVEEYFEMLDSFLASRLALELEDEDNDNFNEYGGWNLYSELFGGYEGYEDSWCFEDRLAECLMFLERENILSLEAQNVFESSNSDLSDDDSDSYIKKYEEFQIEYRKKIVRECYENGKVERENWKLIHDSFVLGQN